MSAPKKHEYKRSWKNLLLNKRYQLRFTLFMVGLSALLMAVLGWWVMREAGKATTILNMVQPCPKPPPMITGGESVGMGTTEVLSLPDQPAEPSAPDTLASDQPAAPGADGPAKPAADQPAPPAVDEPAADQPAEPAADEPAADRPEVDEGPAGATGGEGDDDARPRREVSVTTSEMTIQKRVNPDFVDLVVKSRACEMKQTADRAALLAGQRMILYVLIAVGLVLMLGLTVYGIKMTHKVAGPLHKISLYFAKMQGGKYDTVYNLRKGDYLVDFYEHFKGAHAGLRHMQEEDVAVLRAVLEVAEKEDLAARSPELAARVEELRAILERKEGSLV